MERNHNPRLSVYSVMTVTISHISTTVGTFVYGFLSVEIRFMRKDGCPTNLCHDGIGPNEFAWSRGRLDADITVWPSRLQVETWGDDWGRTVMSTYGWQLQEHCWGGGEENCWHRLRHLLWEHCAHTVQWNEVVQTPRVSAPGLQPMHGSNGITVGPIV